MTALFLSRDDPGRFAAHTMDAVRAEFAGHGFSEMEECLFPGWRLLHAPYVEGGPSNFVKKGNSFIGFAGSFAFDGKVGRAALNAALTELDPLSPDWSRTSGQFVMVIRKQGRSFLFTDWFAAFEIYHDREQSFFSTSLLAATSCLPELHFHSQAVYEHAFNIVSIGDDTVFSELKKLGPFAVIELCEDGSKRHHQDKPMPEGRIERDLASQLAAQHELLGKTVQPWVDQFGNQIFCPLSGGLDSRLVFALLRNQASQPSMYSYGEEDECDIIVARQICEALGIPIDVMDKEVYREIAIDDYPDQVERNFHDHDGLPNFGMIFDNGAGAYARSKRHADGALSVSGGCGEIFRNFFFLSDRPYSAADVTRAFFARFALGDVTDAFDEQEFLRGIEDKILSSIGRAGERGPLPRNALEWVYPAARCRAMFGHEISLEARYGAYLMPFLDHAVVAQAQSLPIKQKNAGRFEARLLATIDPELAGMPSCYGHDFLGEPGLRHRISEWSTRIRPIALRHKSYAIQRRLADRADEHGGLATEDYLSRVIDLEYPIMRRFFRVENIGDSAIMRRVANLEYFAEKLGSKLKA
ncbi:hypothetical protein HFP51_01440 [Parasphingopyxis sp. CP4]|uniref:asparagine synthase-related protein n=1 Tax=Parasphingopyxis sp. CP4 TaxID=2724527 RepID=UPI0015A108B6|nr:asparagine synthase-related protein [Parasphingopyxis sp. CP4]QLC20964.1 hypothetical protein HFP51_01440 [Parasphingopyxis sp. CP4]